MKNTNTTPLPYNGQQLVELRKKGKRPADMILVSLIGWLGEINPCVLAKIGRRYDWRFLVGLDVLIVTDSRTNAEAVRVLANDIYHACPQYVGIWVADKQNGMHVAFGDYRPALSITRMMGFDERRNYAGIVLKKQERTSDEEKDYQASGQSLA